MKSLSRFLGAPALLLSLALGASAQTPPPNRLALVIGEANYAGGPLQTANADASLVAQVLGGEGFDVSEFHDLDGNGLAANVAAFVNKVRSAPPGAAVTVYAGGLGVAADCDDYLLPVDARISAPGDVSRVGLSMTKLMRDLAATQSQVRLVMLDAARALPAGVSSVQFQRGLLPLQPPARTTFGLSAQIHDFEPDARPGDINGAYAGAFATVAQQPLSDLEATMREVRMVTHQTTSGAQTPWQETNPDVAPFTFPLNADPQQIEAASQTLPDATTPIAKLSAEDAYWAAIWRNSIKDYESYVAAFKATAPTEMLARVRALIDLLKTTDPSCQAALAPPPAPPRPLVSGPACPEGFVPENGYNGAFCEPIAPPPLLVCPPGFARIAGVGGYGCAPIVPPPVLTCPVGFVAFSDMGVLGGLGLNPYCQPSVPPPFFCPPGFHQDFRDGRWFCVRNGPPPPLCPISFYPSWNGVDGYFCQPSPSGPPILCPNGRPQWMFDHWICVAGPVGQNMACPPSQQETWQNGRLVCAPRLPPQTLCPPGFVRTAPFGVCAPATPPAPLLPLPVTGTGPAKPPPPSLCAANSIFAPGRGCVGAATGPLPPAPGCSAGQTMVNGHCVTPLVPPLVRPTGAALCPPGQAMVGGRCVVGPAPTPSLPASPVPVRPTALPTLRPLPTPATPTAPIVQPTGKPLVPPAQPSALPSLKPMPPPVVPTVPLPTPATPTAPIVQPTGKPLVPPAQPSALPSLKPMPPPVVPTAPPAPAVQPTLKPLVPPAPAVTTAPVAPTPLPSLKPVPGPAAVTPTPAAQPALKPIAPPPGIKVPTPKPSPEPTLAPKPAVVTPPNPADVTPPKPAGTPPGLSAPRPPPPGITKPVPQPTRPGKPKPKPTCGLEHEPKCP